MRTSLVLVVISIIISGCASAQKISKVQIGMTKDEVIEVMGRPVSTSATGNCEYLNYRLSETDDQAFYGVTVPYYVRLINGRVDAYGRTGDFDSTQKPTLRLETDEKIRTQSDVKVTGKDDLYTELMKLKELLDQGIITQEEFDREKKELLNKY